MTYITPLNNNIDHYCGDTCAKYITLYSRHPIFLFSPFADSLLCIIIIAPLPGRLSLYYYCYYIVIIIIIIVVVIARYELIWARLAQPSQSIVVQHDVLEVLVEEVRGDFNDPHTHTCRIRLL